MGKGDIKTRRGKLFNRSYGKKRPGGKSALKVNATGTKKANKPKTDKAG